MIYFLFSLLALFFIDLTSLSSILVLMIFMSFFIFFFLWSMSGSCWFSVIFFLLFVGGVLVIFMVVSSLYPNSKNYFYTISKSLLFYPLLLFLFIGVPLVFLNNSLSLKSLIYGGGSFYILMFLILCYFFSFLYFVSKDKLSLRSFF